eukprot:scaffold24270_cov112-Isochrysis_galbana.AAC.2
MPWLSAALCSLARSLSSWTQWPHHCAGSKSALHCVRRAAAHLGQVPQGLSSERQSALGWISRRVLVEHKLLVRELVRGTESLYGAQRACTSAGSSGGCYQLARKARASRRPT